MKKNDFEDDGRTIIDMSGVERPNLLTFRRPGKADKPRENQGSSDQPQNNLSLAKKQSRSVIFGTVLAGLAIAAIFIACGAFAIFLMTQFWH
mgnify:CR=1 FL=1